MNIAAPGTVEAKNRCLLQWAWVIVMVIGVVVIAARLVSKFSISNVWDDAYIFVRYAENVLAYRSVAWNPDGIPTFGLTSTLFLAVVLSIRFFIVQPGLAALLASTVPGIVFLALFVPTVKRFVPASKATQRFILALIFVSLAVSETLTKHFVSGMDTMFVLDFLLLYFLIFKHFEDKVTLKSALWLGVAGGAAFAARPDLLLFTLTLPAVLILTGKGWPVRKMAIIVLGGSVILIALQAFVAQQYFGSPLPLPFYVKGLSSSYGPTIRTYYKSIPGKELFNYVFSYWHLFLLIILPIAVFPKRWWREASGTDKGLLLATIFFIVYYRFFVLQIMYYGQRFYYPTLPALLILSARQLVFIVQEHSASYREKVCELFLDTPVAVSIVGALAVGIFIFSRVEAKGAIIKDLRSAHLTDFAVMHEYEASFKNYWFLLDAVSQLPDDVVIASTEITYPGILNPRKRIIDLAGLNDTYFAHSGFSAERLLSIEHPDVIYLPHPHYAEMLGQIINNETFKKNYLYWSAEELSQGTGQEVAMGFAVRRSSPYFGAVQQAVLQQFKEKAH
ncbi:MAG: hypothetical protein HY983_01235 [Candidatus Magasanikbacteria bacterium]|nr:hypothetical protein [Candidatus Magasanikbacteria bacterium]